MDTSYSGHTMSVHCLHSACTLPTNCQHSACIHSTYCLYTVCAMYVQCMHNVCTLPVLTLQYLYTTCTLSILLPLFPNQPPTRTRNTFVVYCTRMSFIITTTFHFIHLVQLDDSTKCRWHWPLITMGWLSVPTLGCVIHPWVSQRDFMHWITDLLKRCG